MKTVISKDGTRIVYDQIGSGVPLILLDGAFGHRSFGPNGALAELLAPHFTVYTYDRRGRGGSGDAPVYSVEREIEDVEAILQEIGGSAYVYGISSGAALALKVANHIPGIKKLAVYEAPFIVDSSREPIPESYMQQLQEFIAADRRGDVVKLFMTRGVGVPAIFVFMMRLMPAWKQLKSVAHTVIYDSIIVKDNQKGKALSASQWESVTLPTLVVAGSKSPDWMQNGMKALADVLPNSRHHTLEGQTHMVKPEALAPVLINFFNA